MTRTKADFIDQVHANNPKLTKAEARTAFESMLKIMKDSLQSGDDVLISGFGKFSVKKKPAREARHPKTGDTVTIDARKVVTFKPSGKLQSHVNKK
jgi:integration host factor subunit alpha